MVGLLVLWVLSYTVTRQTWGRDRPTFDVLGLLGIIILAFVIFAMLIDVLPGR